MKNLTQCFHITFPFILQSMPEILYKLLVYFQLNFFPFCEVSVLEFSRILNYETSCCLAFHFINAISYPMQTDGTTGKRDGGKIKIQTF